MYEAQRQEDWKYILQNSGSKVVVISKKKIYDEVMEMKNEISTLKHIICVDAPYDKEFSFSSVLRQGEELSNTHDGLRESNFSEENTASLIYTSGTTGN